MKKVICKLIPDERMGFNSVKPEVRERKKEWNEHVNEAEAGSKVTSVMDLWHTLWRLGFIP